jgi:hypothetical protein
MMPGEQTWHLLDSRSDFRNLAIICCRLFPRQRSPKTYLLYFPWIAATKTTKI